MTWLHRSRRSFQELSSLSFDFFKKIMPTNVKLAQINILNISQRKNNQKTRKELHDATLYELSVLVTFCCVIVMNYVYLRSFYVVLLF